MIWDTVARWNRAIAGGSEEHVPKRARAALYDIGSGRRMRDAEPVDWSREMGLFDAVRKLFAKPAPATRPIAPLVDEPDPEEIQVPEWQVGQVLADLHGEAPPLLLDVREPYEWRQVRVPGALHIPMNSIPQRLAELPHDRSIVVFCAHGSRSFGVTHFLCEQGFDAYNLIGGITQWHIQGGEVEVRTAH